MQYDCVVAGLGFAGAVSAERLARAGHRVLAIESRGHIGGNSYDRFDENGILIHQYGPHIFHTNSQEVWDYLSQFTGWLPYEHRVLARVDGQLIGLPVNINTIYQLLPAAQAQACERKLVAAVGPSGSISILELRENSDAVLRKLGEYLYAKIYLNYSRKQWGLPPAELDALVLERVLLRIDRDDRYFRDTFQGIPMLGYTRMLEKMLAHENIEVVLNQDYKEALAKSTFNKLVFTGPIDEYFNYMYGRLPYRSIKFDFCSFDQAWFQESAVINYPGKEPFTRITEFKRLTGQQSSKTTILREYPTAYVRGENTPCYPILKKENSELYQKYFKEAKKLKNVAFVGRLAEYRYYNMDEVVGRALSENKNPRTGSGV